MGSTAAIEGLRGLVERAAELGQLRVVRGAAADLEVGAISEVACECDPTPVVLFEGIQGCAPEYRVVTNLLQSRARENLVYDLPPEMDGRAALRAWRERLKSQQAVAPRTVKDGPVLQNVAQGAAVDLERLPFIRWHERDGGRYACGTASVTRDPETGYVNVGSYRFMLVGRDRLVYHIGSGHHGDVIRRKYWARGVSCPVAVCLGQDPRLFVAAASNERYGDSEYEYAGWLRGSPVEVVEGVVTGLPVPADAEVVLEGDLLPPSDGQDDEGPFGEASGYYGGGVHPSPFMVVRAVLRRNDPIVIGQPPQRGATRELLGSRAVHVWNELETLGIPGIAGVYQEWGLTIIAVEQMYPGHAMRAAHGALGGTAGYHGRFLIVVDADVNIYNPGEVLWAVATRCDPETSLDVARRIWSYRIDPRLPPEKRQRGDYTGSVAIIDACRPYPWREQYPPVSSISAELRAATLEKWGAALR